MQTVTRTHRRCRTRFQWYGTVLVAACALAACASSPPPRANARLIESLHAAVPASWRHAARTTPDVAPLEVSDELREFVDSDYSRIQPPRERIMALVEAIFDEDKVGLRFDGSATHTAAEAFATGLGNCMGFSNLLVAAAREAGLPAYFELMSKYSDWQPQGDLMVRSMHVRVTSRIHRSKLVFDFYPEPVRRAAWSTKLSDDEARAHHLNNLAVDRLLEGDSPGAYGYLYKALRTDPRLPFLWSNLGTMVSRVDLPDMAEAAYAEALRLDPEEPTAVANLQRLYRMSGREKEAAALAARVSRLQKRNPYYHYRQAENAYENGQYEIAEKHYRTAIRLKENEPRFYVGLAQTYLEQGKETAARNALNRSHRYQ